MLNKSVKRGDTLIEVMLAVGIFSMVAISVVAVMSSGTTGSQTALETTLTREEIDTQAEALRFIHRAYIADRNAQTSSQFGTLWKKIVEKVGNVETFHPTDCQQIYSRPEMSKAFILNVANLGRIHNVSDTSRISSSIFDEVLISNGSGGVFRPASTYPHLVYDTTYYNSAGSQVSNLSTREDNAASSNTVEYKRLYSAEGIYIVATADNIGSPTFYDFYIRTCWYSAGDKAPSTISTIIRLYNPDIGN